MNAKRIRAAAAAALCGGPLAALLLAAQAAPPLAVPPGYTLVWSDEFDSNGLPDTTKWRYDTGRNREGWYNKELQYYSGERRENAEVRGGMLRITARREAPRDAPDWGGQHYTSTRLITRGVADWTYGFFEVRARLPCGRGTWPAIRLVGSGGRWPEDGELDIMEQVGHQPRRVSSAVHTQAGSGGHAVGGATQLPNACGRFHRYQMHWTADDVRFGVDGFAHLRYPKLADAPGSWPFDKPQFLILNIAIGGDLGGAVVDADLPVTMQVDYVRVYQRAKPPAGPVKP